MQAPYFSWKRVVLVALLGVVSLTGCPRKQETQRVPANAASNSAPSQTTVDTERSEPLGPALPVAEGVSPVQSQEGGQPLEIPKVVMAELDRAKCKLFVGDAAPNGELPAVSSDTHQVKDLFGKKATVLVFWNSGTDRYANMTAVNMLSDLEADINKRFKDAGVTVLGIHVGPKSTEVEKIIQDAGATFTNLIDQNGEFFQRFSDHQPPCLYLLDQSGTIVWLDIEYSRAVREAIKQAVTALAQ
jgi:peroxiredoxin